MVTLGPKQNKKKRKRTEHGATATSATKGFTKNNNSSTSTSSSSKDDDKERMLQTSMKSLLRAGKQIKRFQRQKMTCKLKQLQQEESSSSNNNALEKEKELNEKLEEIKDFDLDLFVKYVCATQLKLGPKYKFYTLNDTTTTSTKVNKKNPFLIPISSSDKNLIETQMIPHKLVQDIIQDVNDWKKGPSYYRRKKQRLQKEKEESITANNKKNSVALGDDIQNGKSNEYLGTSGLFIGSLSGKTFEEEEYDDEYYGGEDGEIENVEEYITNKKKNRKGSRARRIKKMAEEARKEGKKWDPSINFRKNKSSTKSSYKKQGGKQEHHEHEHEQVVVATASDVAQAGSNWKSQKGEMNHPSWLAAQRNKKKESTIVPFTGKKITFD